ncbi:bifunctional RNase H/acid phosphatase [Streptomyces sp. A30]|uniref:bifunctional RNase H/acid phosphatase n=1 Tax=Streptomyces sp. A30 TaxID=2789273 RepID=UPI00397ECF88
MREFIVEADGGSRGNPGPAGYGSVVIDAATGETLVEAAAYIGVATNNVAEYRGLVAGLRAAHELDPTAEVHVRMDSKLVVEQMSGRWKIKHPDMKPLAAEAARIFPASQLTYEWIPREQNKHADRLANEAMDAGKRGEQWSAAASTAELDVRAARAAARTVAAPEPSGPSGPSGPPGDAAAGAARARAAMAAPTSSRRGAADSPGSGAVESLGGGATKAGVGVGAAKEDADVRAAQVVASPGWAAADMGAPATFVLLRHGETPLTPQKRFSGSGGSDPSLSDIGLEQAERVAAALARRGTIQDIVASPLARTRETAAAVATLLGLEVTIEDGLRETDFGAWEGLTFGEVRERYPDDLTKWLADPDAEPTGGGESFAATATRIAATRDKLVAAYAGRTVLLVTHVTPIKTFVRLALGAPPESLFRMELSAASLSAVAYYADGNASVRLLNDTSHLR